MDKKINPADPERAKAKDGEGTGREGKGVLRTVRRKLGGYTNRWSDVTLKSDIVRLDG